MPVDPPPDLPYLLHEALSQLGWNCSAELLASRVNRLHIGLPCEDEFVVVCSWLGRCVLVHKLDQTQSPPSSKPTYGVPDLFAAFTRDGRLIPTLIEVKSSREKKLSFTPEYQAQLKAYAKLLGLPILVAWKFNDVWSLFDLDQMELAKVNYNISISKALSENLLGVLAGDFSYTLSRGAGLHLRTYKKELLSSVRNGSEVHEEWHTVIDDALHIDGNGKERRDLSSDVQTLFFISDLEEDQEHTPSHMHFRFTVQDGESKFAHMALVRLLNWYSSGDKPLNWREVKTRSSPVPGMTDFGATVDRARREGVVEYIFNLEPKTKPAFLGVA